MSTAALFIPSPMSRLPLIAALVLGSILLASADTKIAKSVPYTTNAPSGSAAVAPVSPSAPAKTGEGSSVISMPGITISRDDDDEDASPSKGHSTIIVGGDHDHADKVLWGVLGAMLIPLAGVVGAFGTPTLIVFLYFLFRNRRRQQNLALAREFLNKGLPVPPQLLDEAVKSDSGVLCSNPLDYGRSSDTRKGIRYIFIGLGISLALYISDPRSTDWAWGLILVIGGFGYFISGWMERRGAAVARTRVETPAGPGPTL